MERKFSFGNWATTITLIFLILMTTAKNEVYGSEEAGLPDIEFVGEIELSGSTADGGYAGSEGDVLTVIVKVMNSGTLTAMNVDIALLIDDEIIKVSTLRTIKNDTDDIKTVIFAWVAKEGGHEIKIEIDPDGLIEELNDQSTGENNNVISKKVKIVGESGDLDNASFPLLLLTFISILLLRIFLRRR